MTAGTGKKPVLRTTDLGVAAGRVPRVERQAKQDHRTGSNRPKTARTSGLVQQSVRSGSKKKEVASTECSHIAGKGEDVEKVTPVMVDKNCRPKDPGGQPNPTAIDVENELPQDERDFPTPHKGENDDKQHCSVDLGKEVQMNVPPSDPLVASHLMMRKGLMLPLEKASAL